MTRGRASRRSARYVVSPTPLSRPTSRLLRGLKNGDSDGHVVQWTESFAVIRERMVQPAAKMRGNALLEGRRRRVDAATDHQPKAVGERGNPGQCQRGDVFRSQRVVAQL